MSKTPYKTRRLFSFQLPPTMTDFIEREAERKLTSRSAVIRQLVARGIADQINTDPPPWMDPDDTEVQL